MSTAIRPPRRRRSTSFGTVTGNALVRRYIMLVVVGLLLLGPLFLPLLAAFKAPGEPVFGQGATLFPQEWSFAAFVDLFTRTQILRSIGNSLIVCLLTVVSSLLLATVGGYMLSRRGWAGRGIALVVVLATMIFPFESIMLSLYAQVRGLGLYDTLPGIWLPMMLGAFHLLLMRAAFLGIPDEVEDAAFLDGAGEWQRFWRVFLPQVKGSLTIVALTAFIAAWQDYLWPLLITQSAENTTMMLAIAQLQSSFGTDYRVVLAGAITALVPIALVFFFAQKHFFRGIEEGGLKF
ncbi:L-arabinose transport system permease protein AraQ [Microbacterium sp. Bi98]|uniref:carbohydrate ABC transporter permease n=1 Tax=unclassified Microbacterium TaxID=2609290 RepID=UPI0006F6C4D5|nr:MULTISPECIES: carbohydrate ABC transporter permease [unclassified Microbacterium]KRD50534.1 ABC transporter permease [Microbacterium sp. Root280D1]CAH0145236.1 L-arabinose transport system permease protein AraQ [Microbacterium sp. Bi98]